MLFFILQENLLQIISLLGNGRKEVVFPFYSGHVFVRSWSAHCTWNDRTETADVITPPDYRVRLNIVFILLICHSFLFIGAV